MSDEQTKVSERKGAMSAQLIHRRGLLLGIGSLLASPAIVRASSIMPVRSFVMPPAPRVWRVLYQGRPLEEVFANIIGPKKPWFKITAASDAKEWLKEVDGWLMVPDYDYDPMR